MSSKNRKNNAEKRRPTSTGACSVSSPSAGGGAWCHKVVISFRLSGGEFNELDGVSMSLSENWGKRFRKKSMAQQMCPVNDWWFVGGGCWFSFCLGGLSASFSRRSAMDFCLTCQTC